MNTAVILSLLFWIIMMLVEFVVARRLSQYRIDLPPGEPFWRGRWLFVQWNVSRSENYRPEAKGSVRNLRVISAVRLLAGLLFFVLLTGWLSSASS